MRSFDLTDNLLRDLPGRGFVLAAAAEVSVSRFWMRAAQGSSSLTQLLIARPESCPASQRYRSQQMDVDIPDSFAVQGMAFDELHYLAVSGHHGSRQILQQFKKRLAVTQASASDLAHHERMHHHGRTLQQVDKPRVATAEVIDPHRSVDQDQAGRSVRLRGAAFNASWTPPIRASRLALSRSISAFKASLKTAVRSMGPVSLMALASNSSSMLMVVRMLLLRDVGTDNTIIGCHY